MALDFQDNVDPSDPPQPMTEERLQEIRELVRCVSFIDKKKAFREMRNAVLDLLDALETRIAALERERDEALKWKAAVQNAAVVSWTLSAENENDPTKAVNDLLCWTQQVALDPAVSAEAKSWRDRNAALVEAVEGLVASANDMMRYGSMTQVAAWDRLDAARLGFVAGVRDHLDEWQRVVGEWADATFPKSSQETIIAHLRAEVNDEITPDCDELELADAALLLLHLAHKRGVSLMAVMQQKHDVNKNRKWQREPNERGFMSHLAADAIERGE